MSGGVLKQFFSFTGAACAGAVLVSTACAGTPVGYYSSANASTSATLRSTLNDIVSSNAVVINFNNGTTSFAALDTVDEDPTSATGVRMIYSGDMRGRHAVAGSTQNSDAASGGWSREHAFPESFFDFDGNGTGDNPMVSDLHALFPCDADINSAARSNKTYDYVTTASYTDIFGDRANSSDFEPGSMGTNNSKGRVARAVLYMDVRYEGEQSDTETTPEANLLVTDTGTVGTALSRMKYLSTLLQWNRLYPPDAFERTRNSKAYNFQKNANPFVDHPEWVAGVYNDTVWSVEDGTTLTVGTTNRAPASAIPTLNNIAMMSLNLTIEGKEWFVKTISVSQLGTATDAEVTNVSLYHDVDNDGTVSTNDTLLSSTVFSAGNATFNLSEPFYLARGTMNLLVAASPSASTVDGHTIQLRLNANGITHDATGGNDIDPIFSDATSSATVITPAGLSMLVETSEPFSIGTAGTASLPTHWRVDNNQSNVRTVGTYSAAGSATQFADGASPVSSTNGIYNYGSGTTDVGSDRAIGFLSAGTGTKSGNLYVKLTNDGSVSVTTATISYDVEKYRDGTNAAGFRVQMYYSLDGSSWTSAGTSFLTTFAADPDNNAFATAPGAATSVTQQDLGVTVPAGGSLFLAWNYSVATGSTISNAQALAIDNVDIKPFFLPVTLSGFSLD